MKTVKSTKAKSTPPVPKAAAKAPEAPPERKRAPKATAKAPAAPVTAPAKTPAPRPTREITTDLIAARAYILWEQQGRPHGRDVANWLLAESQLKEEIQSFSA